MGQKIQAKWTSQIVPNMMTIVANPDTQQITDIMARYSLMSLLRRHH